MHPLEKAEKIAIIIGIPLGLISLLIAYLQLSSSIEGVRQQISDSKSTRSMEAAFQYLTSDVIANAKKTINSNTNNGTDYSKANSDPDLKKSVLLILNFLDTISSGIENGIYDEKLVCSHLRRVVEKQVTVHIKGQVMDGIIKPNPSPYPETEFKSLVKIYDRWKNGEICKI